MAIGARRKPWICSAQSRDELVSAVSICVGVTFVAASDVFVSTAWLPTTVIDSLTTAVGERTKLAVRFCPTRTRMVSERAS